jgi:hypothetical protein
MAEAMISPLGCGISPPESCVNADRQASLDRFPLVRWRSPTVDEQIRSRYEICIVRSREYGSLADIARRSDQAPCCSHIGNLFIVGAVARAFCRQCRQDSGCVAMPTLLEPDSDPVTKGRHVVRDDLADPIRPIGLVTIE